MKFLIRDDPRTNLAVKLAQQGYSIQAIARTAKITLGQATYRVYQNGISIRAVRNGTDTAAARRLNVEYREFKADIDRFMRSLRRRRNG